MPGRQPERLTVYLAGVGLDVDYTSWRSVAAQKLKASKFDVVVPFYADEESVQKSLADLETADLVLAYCARPSWSTGMEIFHAAKLQKPVVVFGMPEPISPWLLAFTTCQVVTLTAAVDKLEHIRLVLSQLGEPCEGCSERSSLQDVTLSDSDTHMRLCLECIAALEAV